VRLNVLICVHEFSPYQGSECSEGWNIVSNLSEFHNLHVIYASGSQKLPYSYRDALINYRSTNFINKSIKFYNVDQPLFTILLSKLNYFISSKNSAIGNPFLYFLGYNLWHKYAYKTAKNIIKSEKIDVIHMLNSITFREPGYLWKLNLPFVWGPTGGLTSLPSSYINTLTYKEQIFQIIRNQYFNLEFKKSRIKKAIKKADLIYTFSEFDQLKFIKAGGKNVLNKLDSGSIYLNLPINKPTNKITILWAGQLVKRKAFNILINSVSNLPFELKCKLEFKILGKGILYDFYLNKINDLNLTELFSFQGEKNRNELFEIMKTCDLLVHTSYREATTNIIPEALSHNLPVVCHDISGMSLAINESCGYKIPLINEEYSSILLTKFLIKICEDETYLLQLKAGAKKRSSEITWIKNATNISEDYINIVNK
jgi:glycosyltransferase involved in cell wall biosynthesis